MARLSGKKKQPEQPGIRKQFQVQQEMFFSSPIFFKDLSGSEKLNTYLLKHLKSWRKRDLKGIVRSNSLGWHSAVDMHQRKEYHGLLKEMFTMQEEIYQLEGYHKDTEAYCDNMWGNINYKYSHNKNHVHPGAQWSGVYYIKTPPNCGQIWFTDPCGQRHIDIPIFADKKNKPKHQWREVHYEAIEGRLIMFPAWLTHEVAQNMCDLKGEDGWRVSVSFNFKQRWKKGKVAKPPKGHDNGGIIDKNSLK